MRRSFLRLSFPFLSCVLCLLALGQNQSSLRDAAHQAQAAKSNEQKKAPRVSNDNIDGQENCTALAQAPKEAADEDPVRTAFLRQIAGRWKYAYIRKGNKSWWPNHDTSPSKNEIHYLFGPRALLIESRPEFGLPSITGCFVYGSVHKISEELTDLELRKPFESTAGQIKRYKLSANGKAKILEMATDADATPEPTIEVLEFVDASWSATPNAPSNRSMPN